MNQKVKVVARDDGAIISVNGIDIVITVKPSISVEEKPLFAPAPVKHILESIESALEEYREDIEIREETDKITVKLKGYLGREKFAAIASIIKGLCGEYISAGKESRFIILKEK
ncbi:MAG: hypothetical protein JSV20_05225 [Candidatus Bathyarchaeota archaeon]|nr:MAG: hypothetical protein JSV20_05225 [Candidatus Bathyarchaeota archaeon]